MQHRHAVSSRLGTCRPCRENAEASTSTYKLLLLLPPPWLTLLRLLLRRASLPFCFFVEFAGVPNVAGSARGSLGAPKRYRAAAETCRHYCMQPLRMLHQIVPWSRCVGNCPNTSARRFRRLLRPHHWCRNRKGIRYNYTGEFILSNWRGTGLFSDNENPF